VSTDQEIVITGFVRAPIGKFGGAFKNVKTPYLAAEVIKALINRVGVDGKLIDEIIFGSTLQGGMGQNLSRFAALLAGLPNSVSAFTVNRVCSSGMQSIIEAVRALKVGDVSLVVAGGADSMSTSPLALSHEVRWGIKHLINKDLKFMDLTVYDGLTDPTNMMLMGQEADKVAMEHEITREELDEVAYESQMRALKAAGNKYFRELEPMDTVINGEKVYLDRDEGIRLDTTLEKLAKLRPAFGPNGLHTAGNSSQLSDGAAALLITTMDKAKELGLKPIARIVGYSWHMLEPWRFPEAPIYAIRKLLDRVGWSISDVDVFEINEAFAVVNVLAHRELGIPYEKMNIFGGAIALGHPLGTSGARIVTTLISALMHIGGRRGVAALCHGTGGATAVALEML
jgi:acetyl-CoA C-acetyltransferase